MSFNDKKRQTGRTTRMLQHACDMDRLGLAVRVLAASDNHAAGLRRRLPPGSGVKVETADTVRLDWPKMACVGDPNCVVLVDHYVIERECGPLLEMWTRYDAPPPDAQAALVGEKVVFTPDQRPDFSAYRRAILTVLQGIERHGATPGFDAESHADLLAELHAGLKLPVPLPVFLVPKGEALVDERDPLSKQVCLYGHSMEWRGDVAFCDQGHCDFGRNGTRFHTHIKREAK